MRLLKKRGEKGCAAAPLDDFAAQEPAVEPRGRRAARGRASSGDVAVGN